MQQLRFRKVVFLLSIFGLLLTSACGGESTAYEVTSVVHPTVFVTQVVTQIVLTLPPTDTPLPPTATPLPTSTPIWDPLSVQIYYPLIGCVASRLHVGDTAFVSYGGSDHGIYVSKDLPDAPLKRFAVPGELFYILDGPWCRQGQIIWMIYTPDEEFGFTAEGDGEVYWLLPAPPWMAVDKPKKKQ